MRVATPNDPKLSDGGAWRGACPTVERTPDATNVSGAPLAESTRRDTRSRSLQRMVRPFAGFGDFAEIPLDAIVTGQVVSGDFK